jgi:DNA-binding transcriptional LysR family regulator
LETDILRTFQSVAKLGSISKTADNMYLSVSTVTGRIKTLEEQLGKQLFLREGRRIQLSEEGYQFLSYVERSLEILEDAQEKLHRWSETHTGVLNLAVNTTIANYIIPKLLVRFREVYPDIHIKLYSTTNEIVMQKVNQGEVELGIIDGMMEEEGMSLKPWFTDQILPVVHEHHPLFRKCTVCASELQDSSFLGYSADKQEEEKLFRWLEMANIHPNRIMEISHIEVLKKLMEVLDTVSFLPRFSILQELAEGNFGLLHLHPALVLQRQNHFIYRQNLDISLSCKTFMEFSNRHVSDLLNQEHLDSIQIS